MDYYTTYAINDNKDVFVGRPCFGNIFYHENVFKDLKEVFVYVPYKNINHKNTILEQDIIDAWIAYMNKLGLDCAIEEKTDFGEKKIVKWLKDGEYYVIKHVSNGNFNRTKVALTMLRMFYEISQPRVIREWHALTKTYPRTDKTSLLFYAANTLMMDKVAGEMFGGHSIFLTSYVSWIYPMKTKELIERINSETTVNSAFQSKDKNNRFYIYPSDYKYGDLTLYNALKKITKLKDYINYAEHAKKAISSGRGTVSMLCELAKGYV